MKKFIYSSKEIANKIICQYEDGCFSLNNADEFAGYKWINIDYIAHNGGTLFLTLTIIFFLFGLLTGIILGSLI